MYPGHHGRTSPDKPAAISSHTGEVVTHAELDARPNRLAQLLWAEGLRRGDHLAVFLENHLRYFEVAWAAFRSGLYLTTVNRYLTAPEASYNWELELFDEEEKNATLQVRSHRARILGKNRFHRVRRLARCDPAR